MATRAFSDDEDSRPTTTSRFSADDRIASSRWWWVGYLLTVIVLALAIWQSSYPERVADFNLALLLTLVWLGLALSWCTWLAFAIDNPDWRTRGSLIRGFVALVLLSLGVLIARTDVDLRVRFELSKSAMERLVENAEPSREETKRRVGLYTAGLLERMPRGGTRFVTHDCGWDQCGFAYSPSWIPESTCIDSGPGVAYHHLTGAWYTWRQIDVCPS